MHKKRAKGFEDNSMRTFESQTPRETWEAMQNKVAPMIVEIGKKALVQGKHPAWRNTARQRTRMDAVAKAAHRHLKVRP